MTSLAILLIGFSIFSALSLLITHFRQDNYLEQLQSQLMGIVLILALTSLQIFHFLWLYLGLEWVQTFAYQFTLFIVAPSFFLFSQPLLNPKKSSSLSILHVLHLTPILSMPWLAQDFAIPLAFIVGLGYLFYLGLGLFKLRTEREHYQLEIMLLSCVFSIAIFASILGFFEPSLSNKLFYSLYASAIGSAFFLVQLTLVKRPHIVAEVSDSAKKVYFSSSLTHLDSDQLLKELENLMTEKKLYEKEDLSLNKLASILDVSGHQLSELINTKLGKSFSRLLREYRVNAAKKSLCNEPSASILSIGLASGFTSQSNFYDAFREIQGMTPGQYRKLNR